MHILPPFPTSPHYLLLVQQDILPDIARTSLVHAPASYRPTHTHTQNNNNNNNNNKQQRSAGLYFAKSIGVGGIITEWEGLLQEGGCSYYSWECI